MGKEEDVEEKHRRGRGREDKGEKEEVHDEAK